MLALVSHMGTMMAWAPQSSALLIIHGSEAGTRTMGDTPEDETAPTWRYISASSMLPCSVSMRTHSSCQSSCCSQEFIKRSTHVLAQGRHRPREGVSRKHEPLPNTRALASLCALEGRL